jgi:hypothetical protein
MNPSTRRTTGTDIRSVSDSAAARASANPRARSAFARAASELRTFAPEAPASRIEAATPESSVTASSLPSLSSASQGGIPLRRAPSKALRKASNAKPAPVSAATDRAPSTPRPAAIETTTRSRYAERANEKASRRRAASARRDISWARLAVGPITIEMASGIPHGTCIPDTAETTKMAGPSERPNSPTKNVLENNHVSSRPVMARSARRPGPNRRAAPRLRATPARGRGLPSSAARSSSRAGRCNWRSARRSGGGEGAREKTITATQAPTARPRASTSSNSDHLLASGERIRSTGRSRPIRCNTATPAP